MAWEDILPAVSGRRGSAERVRQVTMAWRITSGRKGPSCIITLGGEVVQGLGWKEKSRAKVQIDRAAGLLRVAVPEDGGNWSLLGKKGEKLLHLTFPLPLTAEKQPAARVEHQVADGALVLTLPEWARDTGAPPPASMPQPSPAASTTSTAVPVAAELQPMWPEARLEKLRAEYASADIGALLIALNALPGRPIPTRQAVYDRARQIGLKREPEPQVRAAKQPVPPDILAEDEREAETMVIAGKGARAIADEFGWELAKAQAFCQRVRAKKAA